MSNQSLYLEEDLERSTHFQIIAKTSEDTDIVRTYTMDLSVPRRISEQDWTEISRLLKQAIVALSKLPFDNAMPI